MAQQPIELILLKQVASQLALPIFLVNPGGDLLYYNEPAEADPRPAVRRDGRAPTLGMERPLHARGRARRSVRARAPPARASPRGAAPGARWVRDHRSRRRASQAVGDRGAHRRTRRSLPRCGRAVLGRRNCVNVVFWGTRGSLASPGPETVRYGGNTVCVEVRVAGDHVLVLDGGSGIRRLGASLPPETTTRRCPALASPHGSHRRSRVLRRALPRRPRGAHLGTGVDDARPLGPPLPLPVAAALPGAHARSRLPAHAARRAARHVRSR